MNEFGYDSSKCTKFDTNNSVVAKPNKKKILAWLKAASTVSAFLGGL